MEFKGTKKEQRQEVERLMLIMESNHFLLPDSFSDLIELDLSNFSYKTYVGTRGKGRYIHIEITKDNEEKLTINFHGQKITTDEDVSKISAISTILNYVELIYKEKHSFENHETGIKDLKKKIRREKDTIKSAQKEIESLRNQIQGIIDVKNQQP